jgi:hypothetical protein
MGYNEFFFDLGDSFLSRRYGAAISACDKAVTFLAELSRFAALGLWDETQALAVCTAHWPDTPGIPRVN